MWKGRGRSGKPKRGVVGGGRTIVGRAPLRREIAGTQGLKPRISDIPIQVREEIRGILGRLEKWGPGKTGIAARQIIGLSESSGVKVSVITNLLLNKKRHAGLIEAIRKMQVGMAGRQRKA